MAARPANALEGQFAKAMYRFVRTRDRVFGHGLFSDPAWDIVLMLYVGRADGTQIGLTEIFDVLPASRETLERCLFLLESRGLLLRDARSPAAPPELSAKALEMMDEILALSIGRSEQAPDENAA